MNISIVNKTGEDIIRFLSQIEHFRKKLWKKDFVLETGYVMRLDEIPEVDHDHAEIHLSEPWVPHIVPELYLDE